MHRLILVAIKIMEALKYHKIEIIGNFILNNILKSSH